MASVDIEFEEEDKREEKTAVEQEEPAEEHIEPGGGADDSPQGDMDTSGSGPACENRDDGSGGDCADEASAPAEEKASGKGPDAKAAKPDKKDLKIAELNDKYIRLFAEFDNFRKRSENEKAGMFADGERTVLLKVLPLIDNFERALAAVPDDQKDSAFAAGMDKVYRAFMDQLKELGVTAIEAKGRAFDANYHNAVMHVDDPDQPENIVVEDFQKGYMFKDKVLRYSMVKVAN